MYDCNAQISKFHKEHVTLNSDQQGRMRSRRNANRDRVKKGLKDNNDPAYTDTVSQGSYAMRTMIQDAHNDYDIDDGQIFKKSDLVGKQGAEMSPLDVRKMVRNAAHDSSFNKAPVVLKNCVRVYYNDGSHVDIPVYRILEDGSLELASSKWKGSSPTEVTQWFEDSVSNKSPDSGVDGGQMRRITRLIKTFMRSRDSWKTQMPSGFCISVLIDECYKSDLYRDDVALYDTMAAIRDRLSYDKTVAHPTRTGEYLTKTNDDADIGFLLDKLNWALEKMSVLHESDCSEVGAFKAWKAVFDHKFFSGLVEKAEDKKVKIADSLRSGNQGVTLGGGLAGISAPGLVKGSEAGHDQAVKTTRAFGGKDEAQ